MSRKNPARVAKRTNSRLQAFLLLLLGLFCLLAAWLHCTQTLLPTR
jgi:hypothetical protein